MPKKIKSEKVSRIKIKDIVQKTEEELTQEELDLIKGGFFGKNCTSGGWTCHKLVLSSTPVLITNIR